MFKLSERMLQGGCRGHTGLAVAWTPRFSSFWQGEWNDDDGHHTCDGNIPIVVTTLDLLREHGPTGPAFCRFGRNSRQPLLDAIGNPRRDARRRPLLQSRAGPHGRVQDRAAAPGR